MKIRGYTPNIAAGVYVAPSANIIGNVHLDEMSSVWFQCVLRGDVMPIHIGKRTNIQDGTVIHGTFEKFGVQIGEDVTVGHKVMLHGCTVKDRCLIGMGSILLDGVLVESDSLVAAGSLLPPGKEYPPGVLIKGSPAQVVRLLTESELHFLKQSSQNYLHYMKWYQDQKEVL